MNEGKDERRLVGEKDGQWALRAHYTLLVNFWMHLKFSVIKHFLHTATLRPEKSECIRYA